MNVCFYSVKIYYSSLFCNFLQIRSQSALGGIVMSLSEYLVLLLFLPVSLQIILPLLILCVWTVIKLPLLFVIREARQSYPKAEAAAAA